MNLALSIAVVGATCGLLSLLFSRHSFATPSARYAPDTIGHAENRVLVSIAFAAVAVVAVLAGLPIVGTAEAPLRSANASVNGDEAVPALERYLAERGILSGPHADRAIAAVPRETAADGLDDVETMISRLAGRLAGAPDDTDGWRMLGWSYLNTGRAEKAVAAYEKALSLAPDRKDLMQSLNEARMAIGKSALPAKAD